MNLEGRILRIERDLTPEGVCPHLPLRVLVEHDWQDRPPAPAFTCECGRRQQVVVVEYVEDWRAPPGADRD